MADLYKELGNLIVETIDDEWKKVVIKITSSMNKMCIFDCSYSVNSEKSRARVAILHEYGIDLNSPANGVFLPYQKNEFVTTEVMHCGGHLNSYFDEVYERLNSIVYDAIEKECSDAQIQKLICNELQKIRRDLLNGLLKVHN